MWLDVILAKNHPKETHPQGISMRGEGKCQWFHCINCDRNKSIVYRVGFLNFTHNEYTYIFGGFHTFRIYKYTIIDYEQQQVICAGNPPKGAKGALAPPGIQKFAHPPAHPIVSKEWKIRKRSSKCEPHKQNGARITRDYLQPKLECLSQKYLHQQVIERIFFNPRWRIFGYASHFEENFFEHRAAILSRDKGDRHRE